MLWYQWRDDLPFVIIQIGRVCLSSYHPASLPDPLKTVSEGLKAGLASAYSNLGFVANAQAQHRAAVTYFSQSIGLWRELESKTDLAWCLCQLGYSQVHVGDAAAARASLLQSLALCQELDDALNSLIALEGMALFEARYGQPDLAIQLYAACDRHSSALGTQESPANPHGPQGKEGELVVLRNAMSAQAYAENWQRGKTMSLDEVVALAIG